MVSPQAGPCTDAGSAGISLTPELSGPEVRGTATSASGSPGRSVAEVGSIQRALVHDWHGDSREDVTGG